MKEIMQANICRIVFATQWKDDDKHPDPEAHETLVKLFITTRNFDRDMPTTGHGPTFDGGITPYDQVESKRCVMIGTRRLLVASCFLKIICERKFCFIVCCLLKIHDRTCHTCQP